MLTPFEIDRARYHLGYPSVNPVGSLSFGIPAARQTSYIFEYAIRNLLPDGVERVRLLLGKLDAIECKLFDSVDRLAATALEELHLRDGEPDLIEMEYYRWASRLADVLGCPLYAYSDRFKPGAGSGAGSIPIRRG